MGASSRIRLFQYLPYLRAAGFNVYIHEFFDDEILARRYQSGGYQLFDLIKIYIKRFYILFRRYEYDILWIEKEALPWLPRWVESTLLFGVPYVLDFDDAIFHNYDMNRFSFVRKILGDRIDGLMANANLVVAGNEYLSDRAILAGAPMVRLVPTVIDLSRYEKFHFLNENRSSKSLSVVWIGSPSTERYLELIFKPLQVLANRFSFVLRVIGAEIKIPGVHVECVHWTEKTEVESISACHIGVMPLLDSSWEQGKCGYKLIQYMACGLPVVASPVGVNSQIVENGVNGFLVRSDAEWIGALELLFAQVLMRKSLGNAGRAKVEAQYCIQKTGPTMVELLNNASKGD